MKNHAPTRRAVILGAAVTVGSTLLHSQIAQAASSEINSSYFGNLAVDGYDVVAYFSKGAPTEGSSSFTVDYKGATWRFASAENRAKFQSNPEKYAPKYGGYCAWAASQGYVADADPEAWDIHDGALYLNYNKSIRERWRQDKPGNIAKADAIWPGPLSN